MGCLTLPLKILALAVVVAALLLGWMYRDTLVDVVSNAFGGGVTETSGRPGERALERARDKVDSLNAWRADSVVLTASEMASLIGAGLDPQLRGHLDSLLVELMPDRLGVKARMNTAVIPPGALGPLSMLLREWEPFAAEGPVAVVSDGVGEWRLESLAVRDLALPEAMVRMLVTGPMGGTPDGALRVGIPSGVTNIRLTADAVVLYGEAR